jgi:hypothetical protein
MTQRYLQDLLLAGAHWAVLAGATTNLYVSCRDSRRIVYVTYDGATKVIADGGASVDMGSPPGVIDFVTGRVFTVCEDGQARSFTVAGGTIALAWTTDVKASPPRWPAWCSAVSPTVLAVPGRAGEVVTLNAATGAVLARMEGVCSPVVFAVAKGGYLYCFDDAGLCTVLAISTTTGAIGLAGSALLKNCRGVVSARVGVVHANEINVAVMGSLAGVLSISTASPTAPVETSWTAWPGYHVNNVAINYASPATDEDISSKITNPPCAFWQPMLDAIWLQSLNLNAFIQGRNSRVQVGT